MPRLVVPILPAPAAASRSASSSRCRGRIKVAFSAIRRFCRVISTPCSPAGDLVGQRPRIDHHAVADHRQLARPHDTRRQQARACRPTPSMTSVWPALCPPWNRTTTSARSDSQSTILPLPSSPHCEPTTTTFAMNDAPHSPQKETPAQVAGACRAMYTKLRQIPSRQDTEAFAPIISPQTTCQTRRPEQ